MWKWYYQLKSVGDNIAHDLRAPLAVMRATLERGLAGKSDQELRIAAKRALADLDHALANIGDRVGRRGVALLRAWI